MRPVLYRTLCAQYLQSSVHPPVLIDSRVHFWTWGKKKEKQVSGAGRGGDRAANRTSSGSKLARCTVAASYRSSVNGWW